MKIVIAPDKFKGSLTGFEFCDAVEEGFKKVSSDIEIIKMPLADGGDGTIDVVNHYLKGEKITVTVNNPFFNAIEASYSYSEKSQIAFIEMAEASGLKLLTEHEKDCSTATTLGTGELISDALDRGAKEIILGIGGSATNDGGMGMAQALGFRFFDAQGQEVKPIGSNLIKVSKIDDSKKHPKISEVKFKIACDVSNPFYGDNGAAKVYGAQKGASESEIASLDTGLRNFAKVIEEKFGINLQEIPGSGAAGGIGGGAFVFLNGKLCSGIELIKELADFDKAIAGTDWIITGEGKLDEQTLSGKTIAGVIASAKKKNIPVAAFCGAVEIPENKQKEFGIAYSVAISKDAETLEEAYAKSYRNLVRASVEFVKQIL